MIETVLNLIWVAIAVGAFAIVPRRKPQALIALACAMALLFPIISITDDLTNDPATFERAIAILVEFLVLLALFIAIASVEDRRLRRAAILITSPSDPRSPPRR